MELNPVVHYNNSFNFEASKALTNVIAFIKGRLLSILGPLWLVFAYWSSRVFIVSGNSINPAYLVAETILIFVAVFVSYNLVTRVSSIVVLIGRQVSITGEMVTVTPFTFNLLFWNKKPPQQMTFKIDELKIRKTDNPLRFTRALDNRVFELRDKTKEAYIVFDYFDKTLKEKLTDILVEVTPPELLLPGRLRHY